jgi:hypothetical protein
MKLKLPTKKVGAGATKKCRDYNICRSPQQAKAKNCKLKRSNSRQI